MRAVFKDVIYRASFIASIPGNTIDPMLTTIQSHFKIYDEHELLKFKLKQLENQENKISYLKEDKGCQLI